ncbi:MAG TPA: tetratricopeptide repeat protein [Ramlibacter sp.]|nr:tetratricopeptide repeat protein [Ramlibacter sp.]
MNRTFSILVAAASLLAGCASTSTSMAPSQLPWLDQDFHYEPALVAVTPKDLFKLDDELQRKLDDPAWRTAPLGQRLKRLMGLIFGTDGKGFAYRAGHSTVASETWRDRRGDCLSLTVLTYSVARTLGMSALMQEVETPAIYGRAGELDEANQHVNVLLPHLRSDLMVESMAHDVVLDFEPDFQAPRRGTALTEGGIVARYYNNVAVENMARGDNPRAYAYFKAAIASEPGYISPYGNLAVLYRRIGHEKEAEALLRHAVSLGGSSDVALHELHRLLAEQGRSAEAQEVARQLEARQFSDPYHWISLGLKDLIDNEPRRAIGHLERARDIAPTFAEVHRYLAIAYARTGNTLKAHEEVDLMASAGGPMNKVALLRRKLEKLEH